MRCACAAVILNLVSVGIESGYRHMLGRVSLQSGNTLALAQDTDAPVQRGRNLSGADLYMIREAAAGYHWNPAYGVKFEPWLVNGWQSQGQWNVGPGLRFASMWRPREAFGFIASRYSGTDTRGVANRRRIHHDHTVLARLWNRPRTRGLSKLGMSLNNHAAFESGGGGPDAPRASVPFFARARGSTREHAGTRGNTSDVGFQGTPGRFVPDLMLTDDRLVLGVNVRL
jgi:hypothetical protein